MADRQLKPSDSGGLPTHGVALKAEIFRNLFYPNVGDLDIFPFLRCTNRDGTQH